MRGDQLARWSMIRAVEANSNGLTVAELAKREETGIRTIYRDLEALQPKCHAKAQSAPGAIFRLLLSFLDIFLTPSHSIRKTIKGFSANPPLRSLRYDPGAVSCFLHVAWQRRTTEGDLAKVG